MPDGLWGALALVLILEGTLPLLAPGLWRDTFRRLVDLNDGQLRFLGLVSIAIGVLGLFIAGYA